MADDVGWELVCSASDEELKRRKSPILFAACSGDFILTGSSRPLVQLWRLGEGEVLHHGTLKVTAAPTCLECAQDQNQARLSIFGGLGDGIYENPKVLFWSQHLENLVLFKHAKKLESVFSVNDINYLSFVLWFFSFQACKKLPTFSPWNLRHQVAISTQNGQILLFDLREQHRLAAVLPSTMAEATSVAWQVLKMPVENI